MPAEDFVRGVALFNDARFFEAHEVLEDIWRAAPSEQKKFLQGLVQVAVAFHHYSTGNRAGMRSVMERAMRNLTGYPARYAGVEVTRLLGSLAQWRQALDGGQTPPRLPRIELNEIKD